MSGFLIVISGPSGAGKGTIYHSLLERMPELVVSTSVTTRPPRGKEVDGVDYFFRTEEQFDKMIERDEFLEYAEVFGKRYGTPKKFVTDVIKNDGNVLLEIDVKGAAQIKRKFPSCVGIFIMPPSFEILESRLRARATDSEESILRRLSEAKKELSAYSLFDYIVFNDKLDDALDSVESIINAECCKTGRNANKIKKLLSI